MELWDAYDSGLKIIEGMTLVRGEEKSIPAGVYHLVCNILVRHTDGTYLLMKRDPRKSYAGMWEATAGGSALKGESPSECAMRELREETGLTPPELIEMERTVSDEGHCIHCFFLCLTDCDKNSVRLQDGETCDYKWAEREEILAMSDEELLGKRERELLRNDPELAAVLRPAAVSRELTG